MRESDASKHQEREGSECLRPICRHQKQPSITSFAYEIPTDYETAITRGTAAAKHILAGGELIDYLDVAVALKAGSDLAVKKSGATEGKNYSAAYSAWLNEHPELKAIDGPERAACIWALKPENWPRVQEFLRSRTPAQLIRTTMRTVRRHLEAPAPKPEPQAAYAPKPAAAPATARVQEAADRAEVQTLQKEVWRLRDKLDQLSMYLVEKPPPRAEDRPVKEFRYWPLPETLPERRPKDVPPKDIVDPVTDDPAFALRKEEFEQWLVRRREALEYKFKAREDELKKAFDAKVRDRVKAETAGLEKWTKVRDEAKAELAKISKHGLTNTEWLKLAGYFHLDTRSKMKERDWDRAFSKFMSVRDRVVAKDKTKDKTQPVTPDPAPEQPQEGSPSTGALS